MARDEAAVAEAPATDATNESPEAAQSASEATPENPVTPDSATEAKPEEPTGPTAEEVKASVDAFKILIDGDGTDENKGLIAQRDMSLGELPKEVIDQAKSAYAELPSTSAKSQARKYLEASMKSALQTKRDAALARAYLTLGEEVKTATSARAETVSKPTVSPVDEFMSKATATYLAMSFLVRPSDLPQDWGTQLQARANALRDEVQAYTDYLTAHDKWAAEDEATRGDEPKEPEVSAEVKQAAAIARGRARKVGAKKATTPKAPGAAYTGPRRNVQDHISEVFSKESVGTFLKSGEIAKRVSSVYPDGGASSGAVQARLDSASFNVPGVRPDTENGIKGARKVA